MLAACLDFEHGKQFAKEGITEEEWNSEPVLSTDELVRNEMAGYMGFAWGKVEDHRGISASRSVDKIGEYLWVLGEDVALKAMEEAQYENYGAPKLRAVCELLHLPMPETERVRRMSEGQRCRDDCMEGCGQ